MNRKSLLLIAAAILLIGVLIWLGVRNRSESPAQADAGEARKENPVLESPPPEEGASVVPAMEAKGTSPRLSVWEQKTYPERLQVADIDMPLLFEGPVGEALKQVILSDLYLVLGNSTGHIPYQPRAPQSFVVGSERLPGKRLIQLTANGSFHPDEFAEVFGAVIQKDGQEHIILPKGLIAAYDSAWKRKQANPEIYAELQEFIDLMSDVFEGKAVAGDLPPTVKDLFHPGTKAMAEEFRKHGGTGTKGVLADNRKGEGSKWRMPSLLEIVVDEKGYFSGEATGDPIFLCPFYYFGQDGYLMSGGDPLIYVDSRWKMLIGGE